MITRRGGTLAIRFVSTCPLVGPTRSEPRDRNDTQYRFKVGLGISRTNSYSQWNPVYKVFHRIRCRGNETIR